MYYCYLQTQLFLILFCIFKLNDSFISIYIKSIPYFLYNSRNFQF